MARTKKVAETAVLSAVNEIEPVIEGASVPDTQKHVALAHLHIIKEYVDEKTKNSGSGGGTLTEDDFATEEEIRNIFKI